LVPQIDMDLHLARVQHRWLLADDELVPGQGLSIEALAHDFALLPDKFDSAPDKLADDLLNFFGQVGHGVSSAGDSGGSIEVVADEDGVLTADLVEPEPHTVAPSLI
jgi:type IV secretion system protein VirD4